MDDGTLDQTRDGWVLRFERHLPHPPEKVWRALTEPEHLAAWFPADMEGERRAGAPLTFPFRDGEGETLDGEMLVYEPPTVLAYRWDVEILRFELQATPDGCVMTFTSTLADVGTGARDGAGWHACLDLLAHHLAGTTPPWTPDERWAQLHRGYVAHLPDEASTIGPLSSATVLSALHRFLDGPSIDQLSSVLGLSSSATVRLVDGLVADGLVMRASTTDGRVSVVKLTSPGRREARRIVAARAELLEDVLAPLSAQERATFHELVEKVLIGLVRGPETKGWMCRLCDTRTCGAEPGQPCPITVLALTGS